MKANKPVRVSIPASVASEIGSLKKTVGTILDKLGCPACCSGHHLYFELERNHIFEEDLRARSFSTAASASFKLKDVEAVQVSIKPELAGKIDNVYEALDRIAEITGHVACATGCDMFFNLEEQFVVDHKMNVRERMMTIGRG